MSTEAPDASSTLHTSDEVGDGPYDSRDGVKVNHDHGDNDGPSSSRFDLPSTLLNGRSVGNCSSATSLAVPPAGGSLLDRVMKDSIATGSSLRDHHGDSSTMKPSVTRCSSSLDGEGSVLGKQLYRPPHARKSTGEESSAPPSTPPENGVLATVSPPSTPPSSSLSMAELLQTTPPPKSTSTAVAGPSTGDAPAATVASSTASLPVDEGHEDRKPSTTPVASKSSSRSRRTSDAKGVGPAVVASSMSYRTAARKAGPLSGDGGGSGDGGLPPPGETPLLQPSATTPAKGTASNVSLKEKAPKRKKVKLNATEKAAAPSNSLPSPSLRPGMHPTTLHNPSTVQAIPPRGKLVSKQQQSSEIDAANTAAAIQQAVLQQQLLPSLHNLSTSMAPNAHPSNPFGGSTGHHHASANTMGGGQQFFRQQQQHHGNSSGAASPTGAGSMLPRQQSPPLYDFLSTLSTFVDACLALSPEEHMQRERLFTTIQAVARSCLDDDAVEVRVHGSVTTGLALPSSDIDFLMVGYQPRAPLEVIRIMSEAFLNMDEALLMKVEERQQRYEASRRAGAAHSGEQTTNAREVERVGEEDGCATKRHGGTATSSARRSMDLDDEHPLEADGAMGMDALLQALPSNVGIPLGEHEEAAAATSRGFDGPEGTLGVSPLTARVVGHGSREDPSADLRGAAERSASQDEYIDQRELENAEELYRGQIEKDYSFSTPCDLQPLLSTALALVAARSAVSPSQETPASMTPSICAMVQGEVQHSLHTSRNTPSHSESEEDDAGPTTTDATGTERSTANANTQTTATTTSPAQSPEGNVVEDTTVTAETVNAADFPATQQPPQVQRSVVQTAWQQHPLLQQQQRAQQGRGGSSFLSFVPILEGPLYLVQTIVATRVPVIKLTEKATGLKVDITFAGGEHYRSMQLTRQLLEQLPQARPLILFLKYCVRGMGIGESEPGGVTSFAIYLMVRHFFNHCKQRIAGLLNLHVMEMYEREEMEQQRRVSSGAGGAAHALFPLEQSDVPDYRLGSNATAAPPVAPENVEPAATGYEPTESEAAAVAGTPRQPVCQTPSTAAAALHSLEGILHAYLLRMDSRYQAAAASVTSSSSSASCTLPTASPPSSHHHRSSNLRGAAAETEAERQRRLRPIKDSIMAFLGASLEASLRQQRSPLSGVECQGSDGADWGSGGSGGGPSSVVCMMKEVEPGPHEGTSPPPVDEAALATPPDAHPPTTPPCASLHSAVEDDGNPKRFLSSDSYSSCSSVSADAHSGSRTESVSASAAAHDANLLATELHSTSVVGSGSAIYLAEQSNCPGLFGGPTDEAKTSIPRGGSTPMHSSSVPAYDDVGDAAERERQHNALVESFTINFLRRHVSLGQLLLDFCQYYGCAFNYETEGIRFALDGSSVVVPKPYLCARRGQHVHMTSPFDVEYDITARMTCMREFQWLCWWFATYAPPGATSGGLTLQGLMQWLSPMSFEKDLYHVQLRMLHQLAEKRGIPPTGPSPHACPMQQPSSARGYGPQQQQPDPTEPRLPPQQRSAGGVIRAVDQAKHRRHVATSTAEDFSNTHHTVAMTALQQPPLASQTLPAAVGRQQQPVYHPCESGAPSTSLDNHPDSNVTEDEPPMQPHAPMASRLATDGSTVSAPASHLDGQTASAVMMGGEGGHHLRHQPPHSSHRSSSTASSGNSQSRPRSHTAHSRNPQQQKQQHHHGKPRQQQMPATHQQQQWYDVHATSTYMLSHSQQQQPVANPYYPSYGSMPHYLGAQQQQQQVMPAINYELQQYLWGTQQAQQHMQQQQNWHMGYGAGAAYYDPQQLAAYQQQQYPATSAGPHHLRSTCFQQSQPAQAMMASHHNAYVPPPQPQQQPTLPVPISTLSNRLSNVLHPVIDDAHHHTHSASSSTVPHPSPHPLSSSSGTSGGVRDAADECRLGHSPGTTEVPVNPQAAADRAGEGSAGGGPAPLGGGGGRKKSKTHRTRSSTSLSVPPNVAVPPTPSPHGAGGMGWNYLQQQQLAMGLGHPSYQQPQRQSYPTMGAHALTGTGAAVHTLPSSSPPVVPLPPQQQQQPAGNAFTAVATPPAGVRLSHRTSPVPPQGSVIGLSGSSAQECGEDYMITLEESCGSINFGNLTPASGSSPTTTSSVRRPAVPQLRHHHHHRGNNSPIAMPPQQPHNMINARFYPQRHSVVAGGGEVHHPMHLPLQQHYPSSPLVSLLECPPPPAQPSSGTGNSASTEEISAGAAQ